MRCLIIHPDAERRDGLKALLKQAYKPLHFCDARDWMHAYQLAEQYSFALIAIDWQEHKPTSLLHPLKQLCKLTPIAILIDQTSSSFIEELVRAGAHGLIPRTTPAPILIKILELILAGGNYLPTKIHSFQFSPSKSAYPQYHPPSTQPRKSHELSPRQHQIMRYLHMGGSNKAIARTLGISEGTVKIHLACIFQQLGATNRASAIAIYNGWLFKHLEVLLHEAATSPKPVLGEHHTIPLRQNTPNTHTLYSSSPQSTYLKAADQPDCQHPKPLTELSSAQFSKDKLKNVQKNKHQD